MTEFTPIRNIRPGQKDMNLMFIVLEVKPPLKTKENREIRTLRVADRSGSINMTLWDDLGRFVQPGDIIRMTKGYVNVFKNCLTLYVSKNSDFLKVGDFCMVFSETPNMSDPMPENPQDKAPAGGSVSAGGNGGSNKPPFRGPGNNGGGNTQQPNLGTQAGPGPMVTPGRFPSNGERPGSSTQQPRWPGSTQTRPPVR